MARKSRFPGKEVLDYLYNQHKFSMEIIAKIFGVSREAVRLWLNQAGIKTRDRIYAVKTRGSKKRVNIKQLRKQLKEMFPEVEIVFYQKN
jgi:transposase